MLTCSIEFGSEFKCESVCPPLAPCRCFFSAGAGHRIIVVTNQGDNTLDQMAGLASKLAAVQVIYKVPLDVFVATKNAAPKYRKPSPLLWLVATAYVSVFVR